MSVVKGRTALEALKGFRARGWYPKEFKKFSDRLNQDYLKRSEIVKGGKVSDGSGSSATKTILTCSNTYYLAKGKMFPVSTASGSLTDVSSKDIANADGDQASLVIRFASGAPTISATTTLSVESGGVTYVARFFDSNAGGAYDASSSVDTQIDVDLSTLTQETARDAISAGLSAKFPNHTVADSGTGPYDVTITAPAGHGFDFTYAEDSASAIANVAAQTNSTATVEFGGIIYSNGASASGVSSASAAAYMAIIASDSDNDGGALSEGSNGQLLAIVSGTGPTALGSAYPTSLEIQEALEASSSNAEGYNHSGATGWVYLAQVKNDNGTLTIVSNINNHLGE